MNFMVRGAAVATRKAGSTGNSLGWALAGAAAGFLAGFLAGGILGTWNRRRLSSGYRRAAHPTPRPLPASAAVRAAGVVLEADSALGECRLRVVGVSAGAVELHGWVGSRRLRARAERLVRGLPGIETVVNSILVRGEDDAAPIRETSLGDQIA